MRIYMTGTVTTGEASHLLPSDIYFTSEGRKEDVKPSEGCLMLSGMECECSVKGNIWSSRWKGVRAECEEDMGEICSAGWLLDLIQSRELTLSNMEAFVDISPSIVKVTSLTILSGHWGTEIRLDPELLKNEILFEGFDAAGCERTYCAGA